jgi:ComF family protein
MDSLCWKCGALAIVTVSAAGREAVRCRACDESAYDAARACGIYQGALRAAVLELKRKPHVPRRLLQLISKTQERSPLDRSTLIVPVPLHPAREQERGFNQAVILARALARVTRLPVVENCLVRIAQTARHRAGMDAKARRESVTGAFAIVAPQLITAESVLLVDDVFTSGATISSCALALRSAGAREVLGVTLARPLTP